MMQIIDMNNRAVCALQQGRPKKALSLLSTAIASVKEHFAKTQAISPESTSMPTPSTALLPTTTPTTTYETPIPQRHLPRRISDCSILGTESEWGNDEYEDDEWSLGLDMEEEDAKNVAPMVPSILSVPSGVISSHNNGLILNYNKALMILRNLNDLDVLTSVILYNLGIVKHGRAIESGSSTLLTSALDMYKMATSVIKNKQEIHRASGFVLLVSCQNMAHIYSSLFCPEEMRGCFDATRFLLQQESTQRFLDEDDMEFFAFSALTAVEGIHLAPAA